eukprot:4892975-Pyramimonas_sp.AAC.1
MLLRWRRLSCRANSRTRGAFRARLGTGGARASCCQLDDRCSAVAQALAWRWPGTSCLTTFGCRASRPRRPVLCWR